MTEQHPIQLTAEQHAELKTWSPNLFADLIALGTVLMSSVNSPEVQAVIVAVVKVFNDIMASFKKTPHMDTLGPGMVFEALGLFKDLKEYAKTPEGAAILADLTATVQVEQAKVKSEQGKALLVRVNKLIAEAC